MNTPTTTTKSTNRTRKAATTKAAPKAAAKRTRKPAAVDPKVERTAKAAATRQAKRDDALTSWGKGKALTTTQTRMATLRAELAQLTGERDQLVADARDAGVSFATLAELLGMAQPGVRAILLRQGGAA